MTESDFAMTEFSCGILAKGLGEYILNYLEEKPYHEEDLVERECARVVYQIVDALNDDSLDDFYCLDKIVDIVHAVGLRTTRHDF